MRPDLQSATEFLGGVMPGHASDWWIIGSAAMAIAGLDVTPEDVDVMASEQTIMTVLETLGVKPLPPSADPLFRSSVFARCDAPGGLRIEFMGGFHVKAGGQWRPVTVRTRYEVRGEAGAVFIPDLPEQIDILELFGRPKDLRRAKMIRDFLDNGAL